MRRPHYISRLFTTTNRQEAGRMGIHVSTAHTPSMKKNAKLAASASDSSSNSNVGGVLPSRGWTHTITRACVRGKVVGANTTTTRKETSHAAVPHLFLAHPQRKNSKPIAKYMRVYTSTPYQYTQRHTHLVSLETPGPTGLALDSQHRRHACVGRIAPVPGREMVEDQRLGLDLLGKGGGHRGGAVAVLDCLGLDLGVRLALRVCRGKGGPGEESRCEAGGEGGDDFIFLAHL